MNTQMSLEEYKKKALAWHKEHYPNLTEEYETFQKMPNKEWEAYMEDFSPEVAIQAIIYGT